ncbi:hypothetical protein HHK36_002088 [Tetracentron sinense]|uniref:Uncharacterized protein n=1 Tax=Tetracentron sinense TaxID=13715 RepID=A0A834ZTV6_TETSI|nr:hypothetical protein HHK36_002088 [Tetracentron sinense]
MTWAGDDWGSPAPERRDTRDGEKSQRTLEIEEEKLLGEKGSCVSSSITEVKIKITKKQLEELLGKVDVQGLSVQQVLAQLMNVSDQYDQTQHRSWRPALQSIPEVSEVLELLEFFLGWRQGSKGEGVELPEVLQGFSLKKSLLETVAMVV